MGLRVNSLVLGGEECKVRLNIKVFVEMNR